VDLHSINTTQHLLTSLFHHQTFDGLIKRPHRKHSSYCQRI